MVVARPATGVPATSEAAVLALLALGGEGSGYELTKRVGRAIGYVWAPARSQLYSLLPRLAAAPGHVGARTVRRRTRPDKQVYALTEPGRAALDACLADDAGGEAEFHLRLFVGSLMPLDALVGRVEGFRAAAAGRLDEYRRIESTKSRAARIASTGWSCAARSSGRRRTSRGPTGCWRRSRADEASGPPRRAARRRGRRGGGGTSPPTSTNFPACLSSARQRAALRASRAIQRCRAPVRRADRAVAPTYQRFGRLTALTTRPDVAAQLTVEDFLAGREPVLERALRLR